MLANRLNNVYASQRVEHTARRRFLQGLKPDAGKPVTTRLKPPLPKETSNTVATGFALAALRFYKAYLSLLIGGSCRFEPTCSMFAYEAVERFGVARGTWLTAKRLLRCHPLSRKFGYDPVPEDTPRRKVTAPEEAHS